RRTKSLILGCCLVLLVNGCTNDNQGAKKETVTMGERELDVTIPTAIWKSVERDYAEFNKKKQADEEAAPKEEGKKEEKPKKKEVLSAAEVAKRLQVN